MAPLKSRTQFNLLTKSKRTNETPQPHKAILADNTRHDYNLDLRDIIRVTKNQPLK